MDDDARAHRPEAARDLAAEAARRAGHEGPLTVQREVAPCRGRRGRAPGDAEQAEKASDQRRAA